jgi:hypothetical protein
VQGTFEKIHFQRLLTQGALQLRIFGPQKGFLLGSRLGLQVGGLLQLQTPSVELALIDA